MGLPIGGTLNKLNIVGVFSPSTPIKNTITYAAPAAKPITVEQPPPLDVSLDVNILKRVPLPPPPVEFPKLPIYNLSGISKVNLSTFEQASADFARNKPIVSFIVDYIVDGIKIGNLLVFKKYKSATHYEIFKRNIFTEISSFQRILFLDSTDLSSETSAFSTYLNKNVGLTDEYFAIMDPLIKDDRIYEYKVVASRVPQNYTEVDYDYILESKKLVLSYRIDSINKNTLNDFSIVNLGSGQLSWIIALLNRNLNLFDVHTVINSLESILGSNAQVVVPKDINHIKNIFNDSVSLFGIENTLTQILNLLGGLTPDFRNSFNESLNNISKTFSYNTFISSARKKVPAFNLLLSISEHANNAGALSRLSQLSISVPIIVGTETYSTIEGLTNIFSFMQNVIFVIVRVQDNSDELQIILDDLNKPPPSPPPPPPSPTPPAIIGQEPTRPAVLIQTTPTSNTTIRPSPFETSSGLGGILRLR